MLAVCVAAYAFSPIDLIPDFIPVLGYLDDLVLIPLGVALVVKLVPTDVMLSAQARAAEAVERPTSRVAAACIVVDLGSRCRSYSCNGFCMRRAADGVAIGLAQPRDLAAVRALIIAGLTQRWGELSGFDESRSRGVRAYVLARR